jgi:2-amino-4-hydroxy-6-hydroxymethyldihydropteridine diphosphokinase
MNRAYLSLGSNIAPEQNLPAAVRELEHYGNVVSVSNVWQTPPEGDVHQPDFLNAAVLLETDLSAEQVRQTMIPAVEQALARVRDPANRNAPRTIDVDLSLFNSETLSIGGRKIPDPDVLTRAFVAVPLAELDPDYVHPEAGRTLAEIAAELRQSCEPLRRRNDVVLSRNAPPMAPTSRPRSTAC